jgi:hypothetical protein
MPGEGVGEELADAAEAVPMQRTVMAVAGAWLFPGLGHVILGRYVRGILFGLLIWGSFALGLSHDGRLALRDGKQPFLTSLQVIANLGVGPADVLARLAVYGEAAYRFPDNVHTKADAQRGEIFRDRARSQVSIYGTAYLWTAGLMNLLLLFDVWDIGRGRKA